MQPNRRVRERAWRPSAKRSKRRYFRCAGTMPRCRLLNRTGSSIGDAGPAALADAVKVSATLTTLDLSFYGVGDAARSAVAAALAGNKAFAARAPGEREAAALAFLLLHAATRAAPPPNVVVSALAALRPRPPQLFGPVEVIDGADFAWVPMTPRPAAAPLQAVLPPQPPLGAALAAVAAMPMPGGEVDDAAPPLANYDPTGDWTDSFGDDVDFAGRDTTAHPVAVGSGPDGRRPKRARDVTADDGDLDAALRRELVGE